MRVIHHPTRARAFTILEMLVVLMLLGVFMLVSGRLFVLTFDTTRQSEKAQAQTSRFDGMVRALRADVWSSREIKAVDGRLTISSPQRTITWSIAADHTVMRSEDIGGKVREARWPELGAGLTFSCRGASVVLGVAGRAEEKDEMVLVSQMQLAGRAGQ
jgi:prepilin-type N-terminal cleavage/methylation domain-containing protein